MVAAVSLALALLGAPSTPEATLESFVAALSKRDFPAAVALVKNGRLNEQMVRELPSDRWPTFALEALRVDKPSPVSAVATYTLVMTSGSEPAQRETNRTTRLELIGDRWKIVPNGKVSREMVDPIGQIAFVFGSPEGGAAMMQQARQAAKAASALSNIKQLATAAMILASDRDDRFAFRASNMRERLRPYIHSESIFKDPVTNRTDTYRFNDRLAGIELAKIAEPAKTVLFFSQADGKVAYLYDGRAAVAFADSSARLMTREQMKTVRWAP